MNFPDKPLRWLPAVFFLIAIMYAFLAGLRTVSDTDTGWHLAGGRYIWETRTIPSVDVMSFTAAGKPWIYPVASQVLFFLLVQAGGFAALSWLHAAACAGTAAILARRESVMSIALAILAVPAIAHRTEPRGDMFTMILFAAFMVIVWRHFTGERVRLWLLPLLMLAWVNLHLGFGAGLALLVAYAGMEMLEAIFPARRHAALARLKSAGPWIAATFAASLLNPWGWGIWHALAKQNDLIKYYGEFFNEWTAVRMGTARIEAFDWRNPESGYWWLLGIGAVAAVLFLVKLRIGPALLLGGIGVYSLMHIRFQPLLVIAAVAMAPSALRWHGEGEAANDTGDRKRQISATGLAILAITLAMVRMFDVVSNRYYLASGQISHFGAGLSWWFPKDAAEFVKREKLPGNIFHDYNTGGYLNWALGPDYKTYVDGRAIPFGPELFFRQRELLAQSPDSAEWRKEAEARGINTIVLPVARFAGLGSFPLQAYCEAKEWQPVFFDTSAIVLVRRAAVEPERLAKLAWDCQRAALSPESVRGASRESAAAEYNRYMNAASIYYVLARDGEALAALQSAESIFDGDPNLPLLRGQIQQARGEIANAEREFARSIAIRPTDAGRYALALLLAGQKRYSEAEAQIAEAAKISLAAHERLVTWGQILIALERADQALEKFREAEASSTYRGAAAGAGVEFSARLAEGRARAWKLKGDVKQAIEFAELATRITPRNARRWLLLSQYYEAAGRRGDAQAAQDRAEELRVAPSSPAGQTR